MKKPVYSLAELIGFKMDDLARLQRAAANERRSHQATEQLLDGLADIGLTLRKLGRG